MPGDDSAPKTEIKKARISMRVDKDIKDAWEKAAGKLRPSKDLTTWLTEAGLFRLKYPKAFPQFASLSLGASARLEKPKKRATRK